MINAFLFIILSNRGRRALYLPTLCRFSIKPYFTVVYTQYLASDLRSKKLCICCFKVASLISECDWSLNSMHKKRARVKKLLCKN